MNESRCVVVTGSSSGIGQAIAQAFADQGDRVVMHGFQNRNGLETLARRYASDRCKILQADLSDVAASQQFYLDALAWAGSIDVWVNAAGADVLTGPLSELSFLGKLEQLWQVDVRGTMFLSRLAAADMAAGPQTPNQKPCIINISWDQASRGMAGDSGQYFAATKAAIEAFSRSLAMSVGPKVRVNCIAPGWIKTAWGDEASEAWQRRAVGESSLGRWGTPSDIAAAAIWLASPLAEFVNGQTIAINGGWQPAY